MDSAEDHYDMLATSGKTTMQVLLVTGCITAWPILATLFYYRDKESNIRGRFNMEYIGIDNIEIPHQERPN